MHTTKQPTKMAIKQQANPSKNIPISILSLLSSVSLPQFRITFGRRSLPDKMSFEVTTQVHLRKHHEAISCIQRWQEKNKLPQELQRMYDFVCRTPIPGRLPISMTFFSIQELKLSLSYVEDSETYQCPQLDQIERQKKLKIAVEYLKIAEKQLTKLQRQEPMRRQLGKIFHKTLLNIFSNPNEGRRLYRLIEDLEEEIVWLEYDKTAAKRPLMPRRRTLSLTNIHYHPEEDPCSSQGQSPLFRLPLEIRQIIYHQLLGNLLIDIQMALGGRNGPPGSEDRRVFDSSTVWQNGFEIKNAASMSKENRRLHTRVALDWNTSVRDVPEGELEYLSILPILQSCRRVYSEAIKVLYRTNAFNIVETHQAYQLTRSLSVSKLAYIRQIHFGLDLAEDWSLLAKTLSQLSAFPNLTKLFIRCRTGRCLDRGIVNEQFLPISVDFISERFWHDFGGLLVAALRGLNPDISTVILLPVLYGTLGGVRNFGNVKMIPRGPVEGRDAASERQYDCIRDAFCEQVIELREEMPWGFLAAHGLDTLRHPID